MFTSQQHYYLPVNNTPNTSNMEDNSSGSWFVGLLINTLEQKCKGYGEPNKSTKSLLLKCLINYHIVFEKSYNTMKMTFLSNKQKNPNDIEHIALQKLNKWQWNIRIYTKKLFFCWNYIACGQSQNVILLWYTLHFVLCQHPVCKYPRSDLPSGNNFIYVNYCGWDVYLTRR